MKLNQKYSSSNRSRQIKFEEFDETLLTQEQIKELKQFESYSSDYFKNKIAVKVWYLHFYKEVEIRVLAELCKVSVNAMRQQIQRVENKFAEFAILKANLLNLQNVAVE